MLYEDAIIIRVVRRIAFQPLCVDFPITHLKRFWKYEIVMNLSIPKMVIGNMGLENGAITIPFLKQLTLSNEK